MALAAVLMNVVFGIIIDTFAELRGEKAAKKAHMENTCFICGIDRFTFDTKGDGFEQHIHHDHRMWSYLGMIIHVFEKEPTDYNGWGDCQPALQPAYQGCGGVAFLILLASS